MITVEERTKLQEKLQRIQNLLKSDQVKLTIHDINALNRETEAIKLKLNNH